MNSPAIEVLHPGALTTIQDLGRPGYAHLGVPRSGAADRRSLLLANRLVGNREDSACLETTLVGPRLRPVRNIRGAITGAPVKATVDGEPVPMNEAIEISAGATLKLGNASTGLRSYLAIAGGVDCEPEFGSRSSDLRSGIGPVKLAAGDLLWAGTAAGAQMTTAGAGAEDGFGIDAGAPIEVESEPLLRLILGPRDGYFARAAIDTLLTQPFTVSSDSDRVGIRLQGDALQRENPDELKSEGIAPGSIQVPADGQPIIMLADHPTTGGYPVIAVVLTADLWKAGQLRPGVTVRFSRA